MTLILNKKEFLENILSPVSRITDECSIMFTDSTVSVLTNDEVGSIILYTKLTTKTSLNEGSSIKLNFKDLRKFIKIIECIPEEILNLNVDDNASIISYKSKTIAFKMHLVLDSIIKRNTLGLDKILNLTYNSEFKITKEKLNDLIKSSVFASESGKIYFYTKDSQVYAELTDKAIQDTDSVTFNVADTFSGNDITALPFSIEALRTINSNKIIKEITIKINNNYKMLLFEIITTNNIMKYIVSAYTK